MNIAELEESEDWQATAEEMSQRPIVVMRTHQAKYHLYDVSSKPTAYAARVQYGRPTYTPAEIKDMFTSGKLKLLKGSVPE
jgi:hypothetical protein